MINYEVFPYVILLILLILMVIIAILMFITFLIKILLLVLIMVVNIPIIILPLCSRREKVLDSSLCRQQLDPAGFTSYAEVEVLCRAGLGWELGSQYSWQWGRMMTQMGGLSDTNCQVEKRKELVLELSTV